MTIELKPIPAFYCCYLLRSTVRKASNYIGSTPNPAKRLDQHNGKVKGGAVRTSRASLRPWEMTCIVAGFPSNIAALQFEWAWHNAHLTRHISADQRLVFATTRIKTSARTGKTRRKPGRPTQSILDRLANMHLLLRVPYFSRWPLEVRFFSEDVYRSWKSWCDRVDEQIRPGIHVLLDLPKREVADDEITSAQPPAKRRKIDLIGKGGVEGIDPTIARFQDVLQKGKFLLDEGDDQKCKICSTSLDLRQDLFTICPSNGCTSLSHMTCLSKHFLGQNNDLLVPETGQCPSCHAHLKWSDLMREMTLRTRGSKEAAVLLSKKKKSRIAAAAEILETESEDGEEEDVVDVEDLEDENDDAVSVSSLGSTNSVVPKGISENPEPERLEIVIEDSDDDR